MSKRPSGRKGRAATERRKELFSAFYRDAMALHGASPWLHIPNSDVFVVHVPTEPHPLGLSVMGSGGDQFGLAIARGPTGVSRMSTLATGVMLEGEELEAADYLSLSFDRLGDARDLCGYLDLIEAAPRGSAIVPAGFAKPPYKRTRPLADDEVATLVVLARALLATLNDGSLAEHRSPPFAKRMVTLRITGDLAEPEYAVTLEPPPAEHPEPKPSLVVDVAALETLPRLESTWSVSFFDFPVVIEGSDETVRNLLVADLDEERVVSVNVFQGPRAVHAAADHLLGVLKGENALQVAGLPAELHFHERAIHEILAPYLLRLGVRCRLDPELPPMVSYMLESMRQDLGVEPPAEAEADFSAAVPDAGDDEGWREAIGHVLRLAIEWIDEAGLDLDRLAARYFGSAAQRDEVLDGELGIYAQLPFLEWVWLDHGRRRAGRRRTLADERLELELSPVERLVVEALVDDHTSLYRVVETAPGVSMSLVDVLRGGVVTVSDRSASQSVEPGIGFACRVFRLGDFSFMSTPGRVLTPALLGVAPDFLVAAGLRTTPTGLRDGAHLFGRLWAWAEEPHRRTPSRSPRGRRGGAGARARPGSRGRLRGTRPLARRPRRLRAPCCSRTRHRSSPPPAGRRSPRRFTRSRR